MFKPFRTLIDLKEENDLNWWAAYLRYRPQLEKDHNSMDILGNMQNFYESFYRSGTNAGEPEFPNDVDLLRQLREQHQDEEPNPALDLLEAEDNCRGDESTNDVPSTANPFIAKLTNMHDSLFQLNLPDLNGTRVTVEQAKFAVDQLPAKKKRGEGSFALPGRVSVNTNNADLPQHADNENQARLDYVKGTRVSLLSDIENALLVTNYVICPSVSGSAPTVLEANFPTIREHSRHWTLNEKQHLAFVLIAAALL